MREEPVSLENRSRFQNFSFEAGSCLSENGIFLMDHSHLNARRRKTLYHQHCYPQATGLTGKRRINYRMNLFQH
jgi:hypothetical protein